MAAALGANLAIAVAKGVGFLVTGSSSMLAEGVHSVADSGNQVLLLVGANRSQRAADDEHPFGYGADRYFYAFVVALVLFSVGAVFALIEGVAKVRTPHRLDSPAVALAILCFALAAESFSFHTAYREAAPLRGGQSWASYIRTAKSPDLPVVLLEDLAALVGLALALTGVGLSVALDQPVWDGVATLAIGGLLGAVAAVLAVEMKGLLIGEAAAPVAVAAIRAALVDGTTVLRVIHLRTLHLGPDELLVTAKVAIGADLDGAAVASAIDAAELRVRAAEPLAKVIYLEPDLDRRRSA